MSSKAISQTSSLGVMTANPPGKRDLLSLFDLSPDEIWMLCGRAAQLKQARKNQEPITTLKGRTLGMIFEKASTRTRVSFEVGMYQLGGHALFLSSRDLQLGRGETIQDSARVFSRYVEGLLLRTFDHHNVELLAKYATVPVINGLSDSFHPCQVLSDLFTYEEYRGSIRGKRVVWIGDGNNMANTWIEAAAQVRFHLVIACPFHYDPDPLLRAKAEVRIGHDPEASVQVVRDPREAVCGADLVMTDVWTSMGQEAESQRRIQAFQGYLVDGELMALAKPDALFMHCLPAHRGEEVTTEVLEGPQSVVWDEAENRLHVQKAILEWLLAGPTK